MKSVQLITPSFSIHNLDEIKKQVNETARLFYNCESALLKEGVNQKSEIVERCLESYCSSLVTAYEVLENGINFLKEMRSRINLGLDELTRMEAEGAPVENTARQAKQTSELHRTLRKIDLLIDSFENMSLRSNAPRHENA